MSITLTRIDPTGADRHHLIEFFADNDFPYHARTYPWTPESVEADIETGGFRNADTDSFWLDEADLGRVGFIRFEDLCDETPMFDLRLATEHRGKGLGHKCLRAAAAHVFSTTEAQRFEGQTRDDNTAMRRVFVRAGWTKEAHYRRAWPVSGGRPRDSVAYAILRDEWQEGASAGLHWHDQCRFRPETHRSVSYWSNHTPTASQLRVLYDSVGWSTYTDDIGRLERSINGSTHIVTAWIADRLIGLARVVSDFGTLAYLQDVLIDPAHHHQGIGRHLVECVLRPFADVRQKVLLTDADVGLAQFYAQLGFTEVDNAADPPLRAFIRR